MSLLDDLNDDFWSKLVNCCNAKIISVVSNDHCKAFLLSESSLFVWHDRFVILTCGITQLVKSVEYFVQHFDHEILEHVSYQRKNEYFSHAQPSCFGDDVAVLSRYLTGKAYRFGELDSHHNYIFHQENTYKIQRHEKTYGFLAYQMGEKASSILTREGLSATEIRCFLQLEQLFPNFTFDDHVFKPYGYSINGIHENNYLTIHITPQVSSSYISIESNINLIKLAPIFLAVLAPQSFDLLGFNEYDFTQLLADFVPNAYVSKSRIKETLSNEHHVCFANYILPQQMFSSATVFDPNKVDHGL
jgi:S-adenosylmethionine decarboxylase